MRKNPSSTPGRRRRFRTLLVLAAVLLLFSAAVRFLAVPMLLRSNLVCGSLARELTSALGCVTEVGPLGLEGFLGHTLTAGHIRVRNPDGFSENWMVEAVSVRLRVGWMSLMRRELDVRRLDVEQVRVRCEKDALGRVNLALPGGAGMAAGPLHRRRMPTATTAGWAGPPATMRIQQIKAQIHNLQVILASPGVPELAVTGVSVDAEIPGPNAPLRLFVTSTAPRPGSPWINANGEFSLFENGVPAAPPVRMSVRADVRDLSLRPVAAFLNAPPPPIEVPVSTVLDVDVDPATKTATLRGSLAFARTMVFQADVSYDLTARRLAIRKGGWSGELTSGTVVGSLSMDGPAEGQFEVQATASLEAATPWLASLSADITPGTGMTGSFETKQTIRIANGGIQVQGASLLRDLGVRVAFVLPVPIGSARVSQSVELDCDGSRVALKEFVLSPVDGSFPCEFSGSGLLDAEGIHASAIGRIFVDRLGKHPWYRLTFPGGQATGTAGVSVKVSSRRSDRSDVPGPVWIDAAFDLGPVGFAGMPCLQKKAGTRLDGTLHWMVRGTGLGDSMAGAGNAAGAERGKKPSFLLDAKVGRKGKVLVDSLAAEAVPGEERALRLEADLPDPAESFLNLAAGDCRVVAPVSVTGQLSWPDGADVVPGLAGSDAMAGTLSFRIGPGELNGVSTGSPVDALLGGAVLRGLAAGTAGTGLTFDSLTGGVTLRPGLLQFENGMLRRNGWGAVRGSGLYGWDGRTLAFAMEFTPDKTLIEGAAGPVGDALRSLSDGKIGYAVTGSWERPWVTCRLPANQTEVLMPSEPAPETPPSIR